MAATVAAWRIAPRDSRAGEAPSQKPIAGDECEASPLRQGECQAALDHAGGVEDEEERGEAGPNRDRGGFGHCPPDVGPADRTACPSLGPDQLAVDLSEADGDCCARLGGNHLPGRGRMDFQCDHKRETDDRAVQNARHVARLEMGLDRASRPPLASVGDALGGQLYATVANASRPG
jgi:hypothetical protein